MLKDAKGALTFCVLAASASSPTFCVDDLWKSMDSVVDGCHLWTSHGRHKSVPCQNRGQKMFSFEMDKRMPNAISDAFHVCTKLADPLTERSGSSGACYLTLWPAQLKNITSMRTAVFEMTFWEESLWVAVKRSTAYWRVHTKIYEARAVPQIMCKAQLQALQQADHLRHSLTFVKQ